MLLGLSSFQQGGHTRSKNMGWTTGRTSKGGLEAEPHRGSGAPDQGSISLKHKAFWCLYIHCAN